ncbi:MAG: prepilin-type N-terminal cleavage/methylation domain-containing protein [Pseudomonadota bacterium]
MKRQQGLSLVELMVGVAIGLMVVATASTLMGHQLHDARALQVEHQVDQDLRAAADLIVRDLRRAHEAEVDGRALSYTWPDPATGSAEPSGVKLERGTLRLRMGDGGWQAITDPEVVRISGFDIKLEKQLLPLDDYCAAPCPPGAAASCPPVQELREARFTLTGQAVQDPRVKRSLQASVKLRNDRVLGSCGA